MEFGKRLSSATPSTAVGRGSVVLARWKTFPFEVRALAVFFVVLVLLYMITPVHFSTGKPCHSVLKGLKNGAFSKQETSFSLSLCDLTEVPRELFELRSLKSLDLANNALSSLPDGFDTSFPNLEILFLSGNSFKVLPSLRGLKSLRMVAFRDNYLESVKSDAFPESVEWLILTSNKLTSIGNLPVAMRKLMLSNNYLTSPPSNIASLNKLELLRLSNNNIPRSLLDVLPAQLPSLSWLAISDNPKQFDFVSLVKVRVFVFMLKNKLT
jgi:Leucine-rich repeat (LRR) protein